MKRKSEGERLAEVKDQLRLLRMQELQWRHVNAKVAAAMEVRRHKVGGGELVKYQGILGHVWRSWPCDRVYLFLWRGVVGVEWW